MHRVEPNDGAVWVTNDRLGIYGRLSTPARALDVALVPTDPGGSTHQLDVIQAGSTVLARDRILGQLTPVDVPTGRLLEDRAVTVPASLQVAAGAGTVATLDPTTGVLQATWGPATAPAAVDGLGAEASAATPAATLEVAPGLAVGARGAALTVDPAGVIHAVSSSGDLITLRPDSSPGSFVTSEVDLGVVFADVQVALIGTQLVVVDTISGVAVLPGGVEVALPTDLRKAILQHDGPAAAEAMLATPTGLTALNLADGTLRTISSHGTGSPAAPVVVANCWYAAWAGSPGAVEHACDNEPVRAVTLDSAPSLVAPQLRVNRTSVVLNEGVSGGVWELPSGARLDAWESVVPPPTAPNEPEQPAGPIVETRDEPPTAVADEIGARAGRTSVLHVLDNDNNPSGSVLSIRSVTPPSPATATVSIAPDGQTVQVGLEPGSGPVRFTYTIDDGKGHESTAPVTVLVRQPADNGPPVLRSGFTPMVYSVAHQGRLAVPVLADWRDPDSDPVVLASATLGDLAVPVSPDGRILLTAPDQPGPSVVEYVVTDGLTTTTGELPVDVLPPGSTAMTAATTEPDVARGEVGQPIIVRPLDNDLPGTDPTTASPRLAIAGDIVAPEGTVTTTDLESGTVTVTAGAPGTYLLTYTAAYGVAPFARGTIRVDVTAPTADTGQPVALLDQAVVVDQSPVLIDVLANDIDPAGRLLAVQTVTPVHPTSLSAAIVRGRWLRLVATQPALSPNPQRVRYTVTNGVSQPVTGEVSVLQLPPPAATQPTAVDDYATVRAGDTVVIPVRDNDTDPTGQQLDLITQVGDTPAGMLPVTSLTPDAPTGRAYVSPTLVRYQAPQVTTTTTVAIGYVIEDPDGLRAGGTAYVTVVPPPTPDRPNQAPVPPTLESRVVAGDTITVSIPTSGVDPDGDSVTLLGLDSVPVHGRVLGTTPSSITYQAYPTSAGTDGFSYAVSDRYGRVATGSIRIAVLPPGQPQPVVAVDDTVLTAPGRSVVVDPLANDIVAIGDKATISPLEPINPDLDGRATIDETGSRVVVTAPDPLAPLQFRYAIRGASGDESTATITVRSQVGINLPPVVRSAYANPNPNANAVAVDVLSTAYDPDGAAASLTVSQVFTEGARASAGTVTVPVHPVAQIVPFEVVDADGAAALGVVYVPPVGGSRPAARPDALVRLDQDGSVVVTLDSIVADPGGKPVTLTTSDRLSASPAGMLSIEAIAKDTVRVTGLKGYVGPAAVTFEVTNGDSATDPAGTRALVTVPAQVGPETPVLRCPPTEIAVVQGGTSRSISIPELCHVWTARRDTYDSLQFVGRFPGQERGLTVTSPDPRRLRVTATGEAAPDTRAELQVSIPGTVAVPATMSVIVLPAEPPTMAPVTVQGVQAGTSATVDIVGYITSQLANPRRAIVSVSKVSGPDAVFETNGRTTLTVTPGADAKGRIVLAVTVTDIADTTRRERHTVGTVTIDVLGKPDQPGQPRQEGPTASHEALLSWTVPASNGSPIKAYTVTWANGTQSCPATPCRITGLTNGTAYIFTVVAHNAVGDSPPSAPSDPVQPDAVPEAPVAPSTADPQDHTLTVSWEVPNVDGTPVTGYLVTWPGGSTETTATSTTVTGLDNNAATTFQIKARNAAGWGPAATVTGQSAGAPEQPAAPVLTAVEILDGARQTVKVSWTPVRPNGPGSTAYTVTRTSETGDSIEICTTTQTECTAPEVVNNGATYQFTVLARNDVFPSSVSPATPLLAVGRPGAFTALEARATGVSREVRLTFTSPPAHDKQVTITCVVADAVCGTWTAPTTPTRFDERITVPVNGQAAAITLTASNSSSVPSQTTVTSDTVYGPLSATTVSGLLADGPYAVWSVSVDPQGLPATVTVEVKVSGKTVTTFTDQTTGAPFTRDDYAVKVGYDTPVSVTATTKRTNPGTPPQSEMTTSGEKLTRTDTGTVAVKSRDASTCVENEPCSDLAVTLVVRNLPSSRRVTCEITGPDQDVTQAFNTDSSGKARHDVPEDVFTATSGSRYDVSCDDATSPATPVSTTWVAP